MAASAQVALVIAVLKYKYLEVLQYYALHVRVHDWQRTWQGWGYKR